MKVILKRIQQRQEIIDIKRKETNKLDLDTVYELIDCDMVEVCSYFSLLEKNNIDVLIDEEGKLKHLNPNIAIQNEGLNVIDVIAGNILFVGLDDNSNWVELNDRQIEIVNEFLDNLPTKKFMNKSFTFVDLKAYVFK